MTDLATDGTNRTSTRPDPEFEQYRRELTGYCYRMLGGASESEDAVQETMVRAWKNFDRFEGRSSVRSWVYRIATNVCLDMLGSAQRRAQPMDLASPSTADSALAPPLAETTWIEPMPAIRLGAGPGDPGEQAVDRETIRLAFIAALQHLPPRQRAVLILRQVLHWHADEVAALLDTTVASVNSSLQRAKAKLIEVSSDSDEVAVPSEAYRSDLLERYLDAFERYDMQSLTALLHEDATQSMPPYAMWLRGRDEVAAWMIGPGADCRGSRLIPTEANGTAAFGQYRPDPNGGWAPWSLQVIEISGDRIDELHFFLDTEHLFPLFGLPAHIDA